MKPHWKKYHSTHGVQVLCYHGNNLIIFLLQSFAGLCGALLFGVGVLGAGLASLFVDRTRKFEEVSKISFALAALCCVGFMVVRMALAFCCTPGNVCKHLNIAVFIFSPQNFTNLSLQKLPHL